jgi:hypothetical protein
MEMRKVQVQAAEQAIKFLNASGAKYKVILEDGTEYGDLQVVPPKKKITRERSRTEYGSLTPIYKDTIDKASVGDVIIFSFAELDAKGIPRASLRSASLAYASKTWGNGTYTSYSTPEHLEILRVA